ncbi:MAG: 30S ribosomal protein S1 [Desulfovibrio sp.]|jgi:small subunit ribosomal protein S1|nr:30S ribosomal protein S1 [Desulfovibrio sp.]
MSPDEPSCSVAPEDAPAASEPAPAPERAPENSPAGCPAATSVASESPEDTPSEHAPEHSPDACPVTALVACTGGEDAAWESREDAAPESAPADSPDACPAATESPEDAEPSFAELLALQEDSEDSRSRLEPGRRVSVRVVAVTADTIFVSTGSKVDGIVDREEMEIDGELHCQVGDILDLYVVTVSPQEVKLSRILRGAGSLSALEDAREAGLPVEGKVIGPVKGGYAVDVMKRRAFCPLSQMDLRPTGDPGTHTGKLYAFLITRLEKGGRNIVLSRRALMEREQAEALESLLAEMHEGDVREGVVTRLAPFGAFLELAPGFEGMVHLSELSWSRIGRADEAVDVGDRVRVKVLGIKEAGKGPRIALSLRQATGDPWQDAGERLVPGSVVDGKVTRTAPFGAFVEVAPGLEGLVHLSELSYEKRVAKPEEIVTAGDRVSVKIKEVDAEKRRISLSLRDAAGDPWATVREILPMDADLTGTVEKRAPFGFFVTLSPGITGLLPNAAVHSSTMRKSLERLAPGDAVKVRAMEIDVEKRRISLVPAGDADETIPNKDWKKHAPKTPPAPATGTLGLALQAALRKKKT